MELKSKIIPGVKPWNEAYFINCYYSALFPMIQHYKKSIDPIILNNYFLYKLKKKNNINMLDLDFGTFRNHDEILSDMGILCEEKQPGDIVGTLKESIDNNRPVMLFIDCFYETIRLDSLGKHHWCHILMIYGYDDARQSFITVEHNYRDSFLYEEALFTYYDAKRCYKGFLENIKKGPRTGYTEFYLRDGEENRESTPNDIIKYKLEFINRISEKKNEIYDGIKALDIFASELGTLSDYEAFRTQYLNEDLKEFLEWCKRAKLVEYYRLKREFNPDNSLLDLNRKVVMEWSYIQALVENMRAENIDQEAGMNERYYDMALKSFAKISSTETAFYDGFFTYINDWRVQNG